MKERLRDILQMGRKLRLNKAGGYQEIAEELYEDRGVHWVRRRDIAEMIMLSEKGVDEDRIIEMEIEKINERKAGAQELKRKNLILKQNPTCGNDE